MCIGLEGMTVATLREHVLLPTRTTETGELDVRLTAIRARLIRQTPSATSSAQPIRATSELSMIELERLRPRKSQPRP